MRRGGAGRPRAECVAGNPVHWVYVDPVRRRGQPLDRRERDAVGRRADRRLVAGPGPDAVASERRDAVLLWAAARHHDGSLPRSGSQLAPLSGRFSAIVDALEQAGLRRRSRSTSSTTTARSATDNICGQGGSDSNGFGARRRLLPRLHRGLDGGRRRARVRCTRSARCRAGRRTMLTARRAGTHATTRRDLMYPSIGGEPLSAKVARSRTRTTTTGTRAAGPTRRTLRGSCGSTARRRSRSRSPGLARCPPTCPGSVLARAAPRPGTRAAARAHGDPESGREARALERRVLGRGRLHAHASRPARPVSALFAPATFRLPCAVAGRGAVRSSRAGITCRPRCSATFPSYRPVTPDRDAGEGLEAPLLERRLPWREAALHGADERRDERSREFVRA